MSAKRRVGWLLVTESLEYYALEVSMQRVDVKGSIFCFGGSSADGGVRAANSEDRSVERVVRSVSVTEIVVPSGNRTCRFLGQVAAVGDYYEYHVRGFNSDAEISVGSGVAEKLKCYRECRFRWS